LEEIRVAVAAARPKAKNFLREGSVCSLTGCSEDKFSLLQSCQKNASASKDLPDKAVTVNYRVLPRREKVVDKSGSVPWFASEQPDRSPFADDAQRLESRWQSA
jgi:hypothetical protein